MKPDLKKEPLEKKPEWFLHGNSNDDPTDGSENSSTPDSGSDCSDAKDSNEYEREEAVSGTKETVSGMNAAAEDNKPFPMFEGNRWQNFSKIFGFLLALFCGFIFGKYMQKLHENLYWFSHIKQVEREISLRTEAGFYYSYFKQLADSKVTIRDGIWNLLHDTRTEHPRVINALQRFNIYPEVLIAMTYRFLNGIPSLAGLIPLPIMFYVYFCFFFSGLAITALYLLTWKATKSWVYGFLVFAWMTVDHTDGARVFFTVNMRENFALPFFWFQTLAMLGAIRNGAIIPRKYAIFYTLSTFIFALFWQFNQFLFLLQSLALLSLAILEPSRSNKVQSLMALQTVGVVLAMIAQFMQPLTIISTSMSFNLSSIAVLYLSARALDHLKRNFVLVSTAKVFSVAIGTVLINFLARFITGIQDDSHIWTFVKARAGIKMEGPVPLETSLYLCHEAFGMIDKGFFERTKVSGVFPLYCAATVIVVAAILFSLFRRWWQKISEERQQRDLFPIEMQFLVMQSIPFAIIALFTMRMKYLWYPNIAVISAYFISLLSKIHCRIPVRFIAFAIACGLLIRHYPVYRTEMEDEKEFWDPETVELMDWIIKHTPRDSSWGGSMQLMAGVKACTGRKLANHPHFEDKWLRDRTSRIYQIYARRSLEEVHNLLRQEAIDYIIVEENICRAPSSGCSTNDLMDFENGILPTSGDAGPYASKLVKSNVPRFCDRIRDEDDETQKYFKLAFENHFFRIYEISK